ncbi:MAG: carbohydrate binding family 9 domain-containing protein [Cyclobacteriaceae bacterium]|nr:carbohydrate binding family 9 domain-containing protein [Cyclobacteriaceae bacterium]
MKIQRITLILNFILASLVMVGQNLPGKEFHIKKAKSAIQIDGELTEEDWKTGSVITEFFMNRPVDSIAPHNKTEVRMTFDDHNLYLALTAFDNNKKVLIQSLRRDFEFGSNDNIGFYVDTYNDKTNGFAFNVNPFGVQREGLMSSGGNEPADYSSFWDNKWYTAAAQYEDRWVVEVAIPFKSIRYNDGVWNFNIMRNDAKRNEWSSWIAAPLQYYPSAFTFSGKLIWDDPAPKPGMNVSLIPYLSGAAFKNNEAGTPPEYDPGIGFDAKIAVTPSLNLDLTVNPDFSQVEVDQQIINLTQFEFGFPERRQFFLENNDLFEQPGFPDTRPFFSRRIGLARDTSGVLEKVPIQYGARLSGKLGSKWRIGLMNMQTEDRASLGLPKQNYTVGVIQRNIGASNIGFVMVDKESLGISDYDPTAFYHPSLVKESIVGNDTVKTMNRYNRVYGVDYNLRGLRNKLRGDMYYHRSMDEGVSNKNYSFGTFLGYYARNIDIMVAQNGAGENFNAEVGFVPKLGVYSGYYSGFSRVAGRLFPKSNKISNMGPFAEINFTNISGWRNRDKSMKIGYTVTFFNTANFEVSGENNFQQLTRDFNPVDSRTYDSFLEGESYDWNRASITYSSDQRPRLTYKIGGSVGTFYNGTNNNVNGQLRYRFQPYGSFSVQFDYNDIILPGNYGQKELFLISPKLDITFTHKLFLTAFAQYNDLSENLNLNTRFQWRFKPASDFFVVYTENYLSNNFVNKNRALVLKWTYWFNI